MLRACALHLCFRQPASGLLRPPPKPECPCRGGDPWPCRGPSAAPSLGGSSQDLPGSQRRVRSGLERERGTAFAFRGRGLGRTRSCAQALRVWRVARGSPGVNVRGYQSTTETPSLEGTSCTSRTLVQGRRPLPRAQPFPLGPSGRPVALHLGGRQGLKPRHCQSSRGTQTSSGTSLRSLGGPRAHM